jgi:hypothetical protein
VSSFELSKDSIDFSADSSGVFFINNSAALISIDTIRITVLNNSQFTYGMYFELDTSYRSNRTMFPYQYSIPYHPGKLSKDSILVATKQNNSNIKLNPNDSLKICNARFASYLVKRLAKLSAYSSFSDSIRITFICSNGQNDSLFAIVRDYAEGIINKGNANHYSGKVLTPSYYLLNGRIVNSKTKYNKILKQGL